jgi:glycerol uptake facilitator-like aquaporin
LFVTLILLPAVRGYSFQTIAFVEAASVFAIVSVFLRENVGHINPFWTIVIYVSGRSPFPWWMSFVHLVAMFLGWVIGTAMTILSTVGISASAGLGAPSVNNLFTLGQAFYHEFFGTVIQFSVPFFFLISMKRSIFYGDLMANGTNGSINLLFPFMVSAFHALAFIFAFDVTGASLNWFRYLVPTIVSGTFDAPTQWPYFVGPLLGVIIPGLVFILITNLAKIATVRNKDNTLTVNDKSYSNIDNTTF